MDPALEGLSLQEAELSLHELAAQSSGEVSGVKAPPGHQQARDLRAPRCSPPPPTTSVPPLPRCACRLQLPLAVLGGIFSRVLAFHYTVEDLVKAWQDLALVCRAWLAALRAATPLRLELTKPAHLSEGALRWLSSVPIEVRR